MPFSDLVMKCTACGRYARKHPKVKVVDRYGMTVWDYQIDEDCPFVEKLAPFQDPTAKEQSCA